MRGIRILFFCVTLSLLFPKTAYAEEIISEKETLDVIFAIDCSGSMKTNDPSKMGLSMAGLNFLWRRIGICTFF